MIEIGTLDVGCGALGNSPDVGSEHFGIAPLQTFVALPQSFRNSAGHVSPVAWAIACASRWASGCLTLRLTVLLAFCTMFRVSL